MSAPNLGVTVQPFVSGAVAYGPLAAGSKSGDETAQISIRLQIQNN